MDDKNLMEGVLLLEKNVCDLYMHGTLESPTANVHQVFNNALNQSLAMQGEIYNAMSAKGWYQTQPVEQTKISNLRQKFRTQQ